MLQVESQEEDHLPLDVADSATVLQLTHRHDMTALPSAIRSLRDSLEVLHVDNNYQLAALPSFLGDMPRLRWINASYCRLRRVEPAVCHLGELERLYLSNNRLEMLPMELWQLRALEELRVDNNELRMLPVGLLFLPKLREVTLENNPLLTAEEADGAAAAMLVPPQHYVSCDSCWVISRNYRVGLTFHNLLEHREVPFVHFTCSDVCEAHLLARLERYDAGHRKAAETV